MAIYKDINGWTIEEGDYRKTGFASRDAARKYNAERKSECGTECNVKTALEPVDAILGINPNNLTVARGTGGLWFIMTKDTHTEIEQVASRDKGREFLAQLRNTGKLFKPTKPTTPQATNTVKPVEPTKAKPVVKDTIKPVCQDRTPIDPNICPVKISKTGRKIYQKILKTSVAGNDSRGWRISFNGVHVASANTKDDAWIAARWMKLAPSTRI